MDKKTVKIPNIGCAGCVSTIKNEVSTLPGVVSVEGNPDTQIITVQWNN
ncbi:MAG: heavy-metal-associated domain-containing protein, partial [Anaerolineae bacterium]|nr:heavy-metal-associated domain-containing protein [Anaerolineae bacterium]